MGTDCLEVERRLHFSMFLPITRTAQKTNCFTRDTPRRSLELFSGVVCCQEEEITLSTDQEDVMKEVRVTSIL